MDRVNKLYENYGEIPEDKKYMNTVMGWTGVEIEYHSRQNTITYSRNNDTRYTMGIIEARKLINNENQPSKPRCKRFVK